jgi:hypothetical protein
MHNEFRSRGVFFQSQLWNIPEYTKEFSLKTETLVPSPEFREQLSLIFTGRRQAEPVYILSIEIMPTGIFLQLDLIFKKKTP